MRLRFNIKIPFTSEWFEVFFGIFKFDKIRVRNAKEIERFLEERRNCKSDCTLNVEIPKEILQELYQDTIHITKPPSKEWLDFCEEQDKIFEVKGNGDQIMKFEDLNPEVPKI